MSISEIMTTSSAQTRTRFQEWCAENELSADTVDKLVTAGFSSMLALKCMQLDDVKDLSLASKGQQRLLEGALRVLQPAKTCNKRLSEPKTADQLYHELDAGTPLPHHDKTSIRSSYTTSPSGTGCDVVDNMDQLLNSEESSDNETSDCGKRIAAGGDLAIFNITTKGRVGIGYPRVTSSASSIMSTNERVEIDPQILKNSLEDIKCMLISRYMNIELPRVPWMTDLVLPMEEYYFDLRICQTDTGNKRKTIGVKSIFQPLHSNRPQYRILIEGGPGSGKSTLAWKLAYDWARFEEYMSIFELVFILDLRDLDMNIDSILQESGRVHGMEDNIVLSTIKSYVGKVLLILDGYDEVSQTARKYIIPLLCSKQYPRMTVVVTSKPNVSNRDFYPNKVLTIQGLTDTQQKSFLKKYLSPEHYKLVKENLRGIVTKHTKELFNCPIFLLLLAYFISESDTRVTWTKTTLYKQLFNFLVRQGLHKIKCYEFCDLFCLPEKDSLGNTDKLLKFGKLALKTLQSGVVCFTKEDILSCCGDEKILGCGFLKQYMSIKRRRFNVIFEPLHRSLVEFLAALYLSDLANTNWHQFNREIKHLDSSFQKYSMIIDFTAGLLELNGYKVFTALTSNSFLDIGMLRKFKSTLLECEVTDDLLKALVPMMPYNWNIPKKTNDKYVNGFRGTDIHCAILRYGITVNRIQAVVCDATEVASCYFPKDVEIPYLHLNFTESCSSKDTLLSRFETKGLKCCELVCSVKFTPSESSKDIVALCNIIKTIEATRVYFSLADIGTCKILPFLHEHLSGFNLYGLYNATMVLSDSKSCDQCNVKSITDLILSKKLEQLSLSVVHINSLMLKKITEVQKNSPKTLHQGPDAKRSSKFWTRLRKAKSKANPMHTAEEEQKEPAIVSFGRSLFNYKCCIRKLVLSSHCFELEETHVISLCVRRSHSIQELFVCSNGPVPAYFDLNVLCFERSKIWKCLAFSNVRLEVCLRPEERFAIREMHLLSAKDLGTCSEALASCNLKKLVCDLELLIEMFKLGVQNVNEFLTLHYFQILTETRQWQMFSGLEELSFNIATQKPGLVYEKVLCAIMSAKLKTLEIRGWIENTSFISHTFDFLDMLLNNFKQSPVMQGKCDPHIPNTHLDLLRLSSTKYLQSESIPNNVVVAAKLKPFLHCGDIKCFKMASYTGLIQNTALLHFAEALKGPFPEEEGFGISVDQEVLFDWEKKNMSPLSNNMYAVITIIHKHTG